MYINILKKLNSLYKTKFALNLNSKIIPLDCDISSFKDKIVLNSYDTIYIRDNILKNREKTLIKYMLNEYIKQTHSLKNILDSKDSHININLDINFPIKIWEIYGENSANEILKFIKSIFKDSVAFLKNKNSVILFKNSKDDILDVKDIYYDLKSELLTDISIYISQNVNSKSEIFVAYEKFDILKEFSSKIYSKYNIYDYNKLMLPNIFLKIRKNDQNYLNDIFKDSSEIKLNEELLNSAMIFFENNLNITESANKLYIHRNTLVYRLKKIHAITGYDIRKFYEAINFYLNYLYNNLK